MEGFSSNLNDTFTSTRGCAEPMFFPPHILPLLSLYNAQWWGYESPTAIVLVMNPGQKLVVRLVGGALVCLHIMIQGCGASKGVSFLLVLGLCQ